MNDFIEKWNSDSKYRAKVKLLLYILFLVLTAVFAISSYKNSNKNLANNEVEESNNQNEINKIEIPSEYKYKIDININDIIYNYTGIKTKEKETITKEQNNTITNYIYKNNNYYKEYNEEYILTTKEEVYDIINYNYISLNTINEYLTKSHKEEEKNIVYLKDIILENDNEQYITITYNQKNIDIDYTKLMNNFDKNIEKYLISIELENIE